MVEDELVEVTQEDREAAAGMLSQKLSVLTADADFVTSGKADQFIFVQAFARHRLAAVEAERERCIALADQFDIRGDCGAYIRNQTHRDKRG